MNRVSNLIEVDYENFSNIPIGEMTKLVDDLTKAIRQVQSSIEETKKNKYEYALRLQGFNEKLIQFERLFLSNDPISQTNTIGKTYR